MIQTWNDKPQNLHHLELITQVELNYFPFSQLCSLEDDYKAMELAMRDKKPLMVIFLFLYIAAATWKILIFLIETPWVAVNGKPLHGALYRRILTKRLKKANGMQYSTLDGI